MLVQRVVYTDRSIYENASDRSRFVLLIRAAVIPFHHCSSILASRVHAPYNSRMTVIARVKNVAPLKREIEKERERERERERAREREGGLLLAHSRAARRDDSLPIN
jgi:hypothetical protein